MTPLRNANLKLPTARSVLLVIWGIVCSLGNVLHAQEPAHGQMAGEADRADLAVVERIVTIPSGDLRRITLPQVQGGTWIAVEATPLAEPARHGSHELRVEILRDSASGSVTVGGERGGRRLDQMESLFLHSGPWNQPIRFQAPRDGTYLVVLRQVHSRREPLEVSVRVRLQTNTGSSRGMQPYELPQGTRTAVAIFSAGLLWTTLLLCGTPIIHAFRSRRRQPEPPWYA